MVQDSIAKDKMRAAADTGSAPPTKLLDSTVDYQNLYRFEQWIDTLKEPRWDENLFGVIDRKSGAAGKALFMKNCRACHNMPPFDMTAKEDNIIGKQFIKIGRVDYEQIGTDKVYVESLLSRVTRTPNLAPLFEGKTVVPTGQFFLGAVGAMVEHELEELGLTPKQKLAFSDFRFYPPEGEGQRPKPYRPPGIRDLKMARSATCPRCSSTWR